MGDLRCHIDGSGWLRGQVNVTHLMTPNHAEGFREPARGVVMHTEAGFEAGTVATFMNPANQVSAFFSIGVSGSVTQYLPVGRGFTAWSQAAGNSAWRGVECEDKKNPATPLTAGQITAFAQILEACSAHDGFPLQVTDDIASGRGLIWHGAGGVAWGDHPSCPGDVRKAQRPAIVRLAREIRDGGGSVAYDCDGSKSLHQVAMTRNTAASTILRLTVEHDGPFSADLAGYINDVFSGARPATAPVPRTVTLRVPAS